MQMLDPTNVLCPFEFLDSKKKVATFEATL
jgi:hypothetical protein